MLGCLRLALNDSTVDQGGKLIGLAGMYEFTMLKGVALQKRYIPDATALPDILKQMRCEHWNYSAMWTVFGMLVHYLEKNMLAKQVLSLCDFELYDPRISEQASGAKMLIDAQGIRHL